MNARNMKTEYNLKQWHLLIQDCRNSGLKVDDWCKQNNVKRNAYYYWFKKVRETVCEALAESEVATPSSFVPVPVNVIKNRSKKNENHL